MVHLGALYLALDNAYQPERMCMLKHLEYFSDLCLHTACNTHDTHEVLWKSEDPYETAGGPNDPKHTHRN